MEKQLDNFTDFQDYWHLTKNLDKFQRDILFSTLPTDQQSRIMKSFNDEGWEDLFMRNKLDEVVKEIKEEVGQDLIAIRCKVIMGKCHYMKKSDWIYIQEKLSQSASKQKHLDYILGGLLIEMAGEDAICLTSFKKEIHA